MLANGWGRCDWRNKQLSSGTGNTTIYSKRNSRDIFGWNRPSVLMDKFPANPSHTWSIQWFMILSQVFSHPKVVAYPNRKWKITKNGFIFPKFWGKKPPIGCTHWMWNPWTPWSVPPNRHVQHQQWPPAFRCPGDTSRCPSRMRLSRFTSRELARKKFQRGLSLSDEYSKKDPKVIKPWFFYKSTVEFRGVAGTFFGPCRYCPR